MGALAILVTPTEFDLVSQFSAAYVSVSIEVGAFLLPPLILQPRIVTGILQDL